MNRLPEHGNYKNAHKSLEITNFAAASAFFFSFSFLFFSSS